MCNTNTPPCVLLSLDSFLMKWSNGKMFKSMNFANKAWLTKWCKNMYFFLSNYWPFCFMFLLLVLLSSHSERFSGLPFDDLLLFIKLAVLFLGKSSVIYLQCSCDHPPPPFSRYLEKWRTWHLLNNNFSYFQLIL